MTPGEPKPPPTTPLLHHREEFTDGEARVLGRFFTNTTEPVFALINLPEVVKGALFARYSRSPKSLRRLFLDEFYEAPEAGMEAIAESLHDEEASVRTRRAEELYGRMFTDYGDDSVAQLGGMHLACEQASNLLTKVLEWGRLAAYLEQSTRYMFYDKPLGGRYRYTVPPELIGHPLESEFRRVMDRLFSTYSGLAERLTRYYETLHPKDDGDSEFVYKSTIRARVCDDLRGLLPAATISNVGIYASGQAYEMLLVRMNAHPLAEARAYAAMMITELRKVAPAFLKRVDIPDRGGDWSRYLAETAAGMAATAESLVESDTSSRPEVVLVDWDREAETLVAAAALYAVTDLPADELRRAVDGMAEATRASIITGYVGDRRNRRHKPGRAMEAPTYKFDVLCDYGIFRDLQRHRLLTLEWQRLGTLHGFVTPEAIADVGAEGPWEAAMKEAADLHRQLADTVGSDVAQYAVPFAYRIRFYMQMNAREAFHLIELRTAQGGHADYRRVCAEMHRLIRDQAGHRLIAEAMKFVDHGEHDLGRLESERRAAARRAALGIADPAG